MNIKKYDLISALKYAFPFTVPVLVGYIFLGMAYGILMKAKGFDTWLAVFLSLFAYCGSMQYTAINYLFLAPFNPLYAFILTLIVNSRVAFYGISLVSKFKNTGFIKPYLIYTLSDETFSILCSADIPKNINKNAFLFFVSFIDHMYWNIGTLLGCFIGSFITFNTKGLDFVLTALFVVIFTEQWLDSKDHRGALIGILCSIPILIFKTNIFIILAMVLIFISISAIYKYNENGKIYE
ncbi:AzlC family ABC transporter permease [Brachyspira pilosicoli]|uniref:Branched-chain amino acid ABC transporter permease n=1 Tax=Brachyspira pilosicoli TaxID=52584 RepID=A0A5C8F9X3_BRAPL|nr:AzlC family ABC transporter permease [Brachyspira pilosicoli]TXJ47067.1 branched-chain amino acid ABC transporter permease [Brachyspira pilosicoli]